MTSKERFLRLISATNQNPYYFLNHNYDSNQWYKDKNIIEKDLDRLEKLEKVIEILRTGTIATPCFPKIRTPMGDFFKMEFAIKEKDFKFIQEVFENE